MQKPILQVNSFTGMDNGIVYYLESMSPAKVAGRSILTTGLSTSYFLSEDSSGFSDYSGSSGFGTIDYSVYLTGHCLSIESGKIIDFLPNSSTGHTGLIHTVTATGSGTSEILYVNNPDIYVTTNNNILYTSSNHLGVAYLFTATGGTSTSITVSGKTFNATYGISNATGRNKIYNLTKKEEYTNTTATPTDTLNFTTAGTTPQSGDVFLVFMDNKFVFNTSIKRGNHFSNQLITTDWVRQIKLIGSDYWVLNGNYIASLNIDEATFAATAKQLPYNVQATCFDENNGMMLVGGDKFGDGRLMLWDTFTDGWLSILNISKSPDAITAYKSGWLVMAGNVLYYTDGYQVQEISIYPDMPHYRSELNTHYNGLIINQGRLLANIAPGVGNRARNGVAIYDFINGWSFTPITTSGGKATYTGNGGALFTYVNPSTGLPIIITAFKSEATTANILTKLYDSVEADKSVILSFDLPYKVRVNKVELKVQYKYNEYSPTTQADRYITMSYGDGKHLLFDQTQVGAGSDADTIVNTQGAQHPGLVGQEIIMARGNVTGERSFITSITNAGTATETWEISPALSTTPTTGITIYKQNLYKSETKTITAGTITDNLTFNVSGFYSDKLFVEFYITGGYVNLDILGVNIY